MRKEDRNTAKVSLNIVNHKKSKGCGQLSQFKVRISCLIPWSEPVLRLQIQELKNSNPHEEGPCNTKCIQLFYQLFFSRCTAISLSNYTGVRSYLTLSRATWHRDQVDIDVWGPKHRLSNKPHSSQYHGNVGGEDMTQWGSSWELTYSGSSGSSLGPSPLAGETRRKKEVHGDLQFQRELMCVLLLSCFKFPKGKASQTKSWRWDLCSPRSKWLMRDVLPRAAFSTEPVTLRA